MAVEEWVKEKDFYIHTNNILEGLWFRVVEEMVCEWLSNDGRREEGVGEEGNGETFFWRCGD
ncbi:STS14 protein-like [Sesbania bispinosa]|nr:STS14 protein-like [Sesbania bispinosa]